MPVAGATGVLVLIPCAITLERLAARGDFGLEFWLMQAVELAGGALNVTLLALNFRDGLALSGTRRRRPRPQAAAGIGRP